jgi:hypothetical protein
MGNPGTFLTAHLPYPGCMCTLGNPRFRAHTTPTNPNLNFQQPYYQTMAYGLNIPPMGMGVPHSPIPDIFFPRTPPYVTPNPRVEGEVNDGVRDQIPVTLREFGFTPKDRARSYQNLYLKYIDMIPYPRVMTLKPCMNTQGSFLHKLMTWASPMCTRLGCSHYLSPGHPLIGLPPYLQT